MLAFLRKNQIPVSACFCVLLSLYILTVSARGQLKNEPVSVVLMWLMRPLQIAAQSTSGWLIRYSRELSDPVGLQIGKRAAAQTHSNSRGRAAKIFGGASDPSQTAELLDFRTQLPAKALTASIIADSASSWFQGCVLDKGSADGVQKDMAVVTPLGVIGKVVSDQHA
jgi:rod shape-determining protein MreC